MFCFPLVTIVEITFTPQAVTVGIFLKLGSHLPKKYLIFFIKGSLQMLENAFYFTLKALFGS